MFDDTTITDRPRTVMWSDNSHPTSVVNLSFKGLTFLLPTKGVQSKVEKKNWLDAGHPYHGQQLYMVFNNGILTSDFLIMNQTH